MSNYWENRAANRMFEDMKNAEEAAEDVRRLYMRASSYIQSYGEETFEAFRRQTGLSEAEARRYIAQARTPSDMQEVLNFINQIQDPAKRQEILNWMKASATQSRLAGLASLHNAIDTLLPLLYAQELRTHQDVYREIIQDAYLHKTFDIQQYAGYGKYVTPMDAKRIDRLMRERWMGSNYSSRLWGNTARLAKSLRDELMVSFLTGRPQLQAWRAIDEEFQKGHSAARRLIRTESNYLANQAHTEAYRDSGIDKYIYVATLDLRTSEICRNLDGKTFSVKDAQPGKNYPPMHPWCRSTTIAWIPDQLRARMKRTARDPITGRNYKVPANMTYNEWHAKYVKGSVPNMRRKRSPLKAPYYVNPNKDKTAGISEVATIDPDKYADAASGTIRSKRLILTDKQKQHIIDRRGQAFYDKYAEAFKEIAEDPDYIFLDKKHANSAVACKTVDGKNISLVIKLAVATDRKGLENSIITAIVESDKRYAQRLRNNKPFYTKEQ